MPTPRKRQRSKKTSKKSTRRQSPKKRPQKKGRNRWIRLFLGLFLVLFVVTGAMFLWAEYNVQMFLANYQRGHFEVAGIEGKLGKNTLVPLPLLNNPEDRGLTVQLPPSEIPPIIVKSILAIEDRRFYEHHGIDVWAVGRATVSNLTAGGIVQGASTLTQQLAKNLFLSPKRTFARKFQELFISLVLELHLTKKELLTFYINDVYLGQEGRVPLRGVSLASKSYFRKKANELTTDEAALLAGLIRAPSAYNPRRHPERARKRRNVVLDALVESGDLSAADAARFKKKPLQIEPPLTTRRYAPFFEIALEKALREEVLLDSLQGRSATVVTGLSKDLQECGEVAVLAGLKKLESTYSRLNGRNRKLEAGLVALDPLSGLVRTWVGGRDYAINQFDHVQQAKRPIGSTVKPFIYLTALDPALNSYKPATLRSVLPDKPISVPLSGGKTWEPSNADKKFRGNVTLRYALEHSLNLPPIHVTKRVGIDAVRATLQRFHVHPNPPAVLAISLGALETDLFSLTAGYGAFANEGRYVTPRFFDRIEDGSGEVLYRSPHYEVKVADPGPVYLLSDVLGGVVERGTARRAKPATTFPYVGGKTGTSQDGRDAWFIGFTPRLVAGVWVGFDDNHPIRLGGGTAAAPIWKNFIDCSTPYIETPALIPPTEVVRVSLDAVTGDLFTDRCPESNRVTELFLKGTEPTQRCSLHGGVVASEKSTSRERLRDERKKPRGFFDRLFDF